ncbi:ribonuclease domain-containing protein [Oceanobacillus luteolus]|uniref:Ribonuclease n=1 Tax=Oceanobacillus luteolus TaxID=1274358 RepID=A0ABW4HWX5_9BACI
MPKKIIYLFFLTLLSILLAGCSPTDLLDVLQDEDLTDITEDGHYTSKEEVALYIHTYNKLPPNYITKREASELGWEASEGNLWEVTDKKSIGGDKFYNREGKLPKKEGRQYYEADINYEGGYRGPERIVYSNDGLIYYTDDHYETFTLLYGDE